MWRKVILFASLVLGGLFLTEGSFTRAHVPTHEQGDWNGDFEIDISDAVSIGSYLFLGGPPAVPVGCNDNPEFPPSVPNFEQGDTNGDNTLDVSDMISLLYYLYMGGPPPVHLECI